MSDPFFLRTVDRRQLFAVANPCTPQKPAKTGVLFCHAFGEERQKIYRATYHFANMLSGLGYPNLRFDYIGTGDSDGALEDASMDSMLADTLLTAERARNVLQVEQLVLLGIRLGAVIAARATSVLGYADSCIMWNPVVNGSDYLRELRRTEKIIKMTGKRGVVPPIVPPEDSDSTVIEADLMTSAMTEQLSAVDLATEALSIERLFVTGREDDEKELSGIRNLVEANDDTIKEIDCWLKQPREYWSTRSMYDAYFPEPTFDATARWLRKS